MIENLERVLREQPFLAKLPEPSIAFLTGCAKNVRYATGELLFREGDPADALYLIREGRIGLEIQDPARGACEVETLGEGEILGWAWLFPPYRWHVDARATTETRALVFDGRCLREKLEHDHTLGFEIVKRLLFQLHQRLERARLQKLDVYGTRNG
jgi:CRP-like cAMP-binding protein